MTAADTHTLQGFVFETGGHVGSVNTVVSGKLFAHSGDEVLFRVPV